MRSHFVTSAIAALALGVAAPAQAAIPAEGDPVLFWNDLAISLVGGPAPAQARIMAAMNAAMHDAVNRTYNVSTNYYNQGVAAPGGNVRAAAAVAARNVLVALNAANAGAYDTALAGQLAQIGNNSRKTDGMITGAAYATAMLIARTGDGSTPPPGFIYTPGTDPGDWRPTPPMNGQAAIPHFKDVTPFLMNSPSQFRPGAPPELGSAEYAAAYNEVKVIGSATATLAERSEDQTRSALFWDTSNGTTWHRIAVDLIADDGKTTLENARIMAKTSAAIADSLIAGWDSKYTYNLWRPITAIREGDTDGNDATEKDGGWTSLFNAPPHPSYLSTHSLQSGAASAVLLSFGIDQAFCNTIGMDTRCFEFGLAQAGQDAADSRLWGGIHFRFDNEIGLSTGQAIARWTLAQDAFNAVPEPGSWAMMIAGFGLAGAALRRRTPARFFFG